MLSLMASLVLQMVKNVPAMQEMGFVRFQSRALAGKLLLAGQIWSIASFCMTPKFRMILIFFLLTFTFWGGMGGFFPDFIYLSVACRLLVPWPGIEPVPLAVVSWSLNHWTVREAPTFTFFNGWIEIKRWIYFCEHDNDKNLSSFAQALFVYRLGQFCLVGVSLTQKRKDGIVGMR